MYPDARIFYVTALLNLLLDQIPPISVWMSYLQAPHGSPEPVVALDPLGFEPPSRSPARLDAMDNLFEIKCNSTKLYVRCSRVHPWHGIYQSIARELLLNRQISRKELEHPNTKLC